MKLENEAKTAVSNYQKDAMNNDKYKTAQQAISKLTSYYSKGLKDTLNKQVAVSKKQADDATKAQQAKSASDSKAKTANTNKQESASTGATKDNGNNANVASDTQNTANNDVVAGSNSYGGGSQNNYSQDNSNSGSYNQGNSGPGNLNSNSNTNTGGNGSSSNNGSNGGGNTGQPSHTTKYLGWVSVDGIRKYTKLCDTVAEAQSFVDSTVNSAEVINLGFDHSIGYGLDTVEV